MRTLYGGHPPSDAVFLAELDCSSVEDSNPDNSSSKPPKAITPPAKKKPRRPRRDPRFKTTNELPGLFDETKKKQDGEQLSG